MATELGYLTLGAADVSRAQAFYGSLFGWQFKGAASESGYAHVANTKLPMGLVQSAEGQPTLYFRVEDIEAAVLQVRALGGSAETPIESDSGWSCGCTDNQGSKFSLWQPSAEFAGPPDPDVLEARMRAICMALPQVTEKEGGRAAWQVRAKSFVMFMDKHHGDGRIGIWAKATHEAQDMLVHSSPEMFYVPPYMGPSGWVGMRLDLPGTDWEMAANIARDAYRLAAPKRLAGLV